MSEFIIAHEQIQELIERSALEAIDGYKMGVAKQIWSFPKLPEIVRCRDCKHGMAYAFAAYCDYMGHVVEPDGFCAWAERRQP